MPQAPGHRAATVLAYAVSPLSLPPVLFGLAAAHAGADGAEILWTVAIGLVCFGLAPLAYLFYLVRQNRAASIEVRNRRQRTPGFVFGIVSNGVGLALVIVLHGTAAPLVASLMGLQLVNTVVLMMVTWRWKISIHTSATAGFVAVLLVLAYGLTGGSPLIRPAAALALLPLVPLMMWARVRTGAHTTWQVVGGALFGLVVPVAELYALVQFGILHSTL